jgi:hypothetical protein
MHLEVIYPDPADVMNGRAALKKLAIETDLLPDIGDALDLGTRPMRVHDRHFKIVNDILEGVLMLR